MVATHIIRMQAEVDETSPVVVREPSLRTEISEILAKNIGALMLMPLRDEMKEAFYAVDPEGGGFIDTAGLKGLMARMGEPELTDEAITALFSAADGDGDGKINYEQWNKLMISTASGEAPPTPGGGEEEKKGLFGGLFGK